MPLRRNRDFILYDLGPDQYSWRGLSWFVVVYVGAFIAGGLVGPAAYQLVGILAEGSPESSFLYYLHGKDLDDYVDRIRLLGAAVSLVWLIQHTRLWGKFGYCWDRQNIRWFISWYSVGIGSLGIVILLQGGLLEVDLVRPWGALPKVLASALLGGVFLGWLEESIFRGMVFRMFYTAMKPVLAVILSALLFAVVHFKSVHMEPTSDISWYSGMGVAAKSFLSVFFTFEFFRFLNLFLAGVVLNFVFLRYHSLIPCMALHAGWVLVRNSWGKLVEVQDGAGVLWLGSRSVVNGILPMLILGILAVYLYASYARQHDDSNPQATRDSE